MTTSVHHIARQLSRPANVSALAGIRRGIERETLRVTPDGNLAATQHPEALGAPLTHPWITTDYAESMLEFITPAHTDGVESIEVLSDIHRYTQLQLGGELLWPFSMPCAVDDEADISLANYGTSSTGAQKVRYRQSLQHRYGSIMQIISGVHYNFSMPDHFWPVLQKIRGDKQPLQDFISESYFGLIRNFLRLGWLIPYLFGASPVVDQTFLHRSRNKHTLKPLGRKSYFLPHATSLRVSDLGYSAPEQDKLSISYNNLTAFIRDLLAATGQSGREIEKEGNTNILLEESELYAPIRPKRVMGDGEKLSGALGERGVQYVEIRSMDINPYSAIGIDAEQVCFLDLFLSYCLLKESPEISDKQLREVKQNQQQVAKYGRKKGLPLHDNGRSRALTDWAGEIFSEMEEIADLLDLANQGNSHRTALKCQYEKLLDPSLTPSARLLQDLRERELEFDELGMKMAEKHRITLLRNDYKRLHEKDFAQESVKSWMSLRALEDTETSTFSDSPAPKNIAAPRGQKFKRTGIQGPCLSRQMAS